MKTFGEETDPDAVLWEPSDGGGSAMATIVCHRKMENWASGLRRKGNIAKKKREWNSETALGSVGPHPVAGKNICKDVR